MPRSRMDEIIELAEENEGLFTSATARKVGISDSVLVRLMQRGRLERVARGVYRIPYLGKDPFAQYREVVLWARANRGPDLVALSHETALAVYGVSDANPAKIHLTVPKNARLRRSQPKSLQLHQADLYSGDIVIHEGLPLTTIPRTVNDLLATHMRPDIIRQTIRDARQEGYVLSAEARRLQRAVDRAELSAIPGKADQQ